MSEPTIEHRLSKGLELSHGASRDLRADPRPEGGHRCAGCDGEFGTEESVMWIAEQPYHVRCGRAVVEQREADARRELRRRLGRAPEAPAGRADPPV